MFGCLHKLRPSKNRPVNKTFPSQTISPRKPAKRAHSLPTLRLSLSRSSDKTTTSVNKEKSLITPKKKFCSKLLETISPSKKAPRNLEMTKHSNLDQDISASLSSFVIAHEKFCTSSPVCQKKTRKIRKKVSDVIVNGMSPDGAKPTFNFRESMEDSLYESNEKFKSSKSSKDCRTERFVSLCTNSKSDTELLSYLEEEDVLEQIDLSRDNPLRHSHPGMGNTTRKESCRELLKCLVSNMKKSDESEAESSEGVSLLSFFEDSFEEVNGGRKSMRETLLEISRRRNLSTVEISEHESTEESFGARYCNSIWNFLRVGLDGVREDYEHECLDVVEEVESRSRQFCRIGEGDSFPKYNSCVEEDIRYRSPDNSYAITTYI